MPTDRNGAAAHAAVRRRAIAHLKRVDPQLGAVIAQVGPCRWTGTTDHTHFGFVLRCIVYQQLSGKAAATIFGRVQDAYSGRTPTPTQLLATPVSRLRAAGLSGRKVEYAMELARRTQSGDVPVHRLHRMSDDDVMEALVALRGIGRWTAQMVLMFHLGRADVFPELDLGIQKALQRLYRLRKLPTPERATALGARWAPYRSVATWYLWRSLELDG